MIHQRASRKAVVNQIMKHANGIGQSKTYSANNPETSTIGQNGHSISIKAHSGKSMDNLRTVANQYTEFLKQSYGGRVVKYINADTMKEFITYKLDTGASEGTANTYLSTLGKIADNLNNLGVNTVSRQEITEYRYELRDYGHTLKANHTDRSNENPQAIINQMNQASPYGLSSELQLKAGLRVDDAINIADKIKINDNNTLTVIASKNGLDYQTKELSTELIDRVAQAIENNYKVSYQEYRDTLKEAVEETGQAWNGTHSLRYDYAQHEKAEGVSLAEISSTMGHSREEITVHYLGPQG